MHTHFTQKDARLDNTKCPLGEICFSGGGRHFITPGLLKKTLSLTLRISVCGLGVQQDGEGVESAHAPPLRDLRVPIPSPDKGCAAKRQPWTRVSVLESSRLDG